MGKDRRMTDVVKKIKHMKKEDYIVLVLVGILLVIIALPTDKAENVEPLESSEIVLNEKVDQNTQKSDNNMCYHTEDDCMSSFYYAENLERKVESILKNVSGIGNVSVMITLSNMGETVVEKDTEVTCSSTDETDAAGGKRTLEEKSQNYETVFTVNELGNSVPYVVQNRMPSVTGVVVIAQGAGDKVVKQNIIDALEVLFNISEHKIKVIKMKS